MNAAAAARHAVRLSAMAGVILQLAACNDGWKLDHQDIDVQKTMPSLQFVLTDASTGKVASAADFRGEISEAELHKVTATFDAAYSVHPSPDPAKYTVTHTSAVYVFNRQGEPEFIIAGLASETPDLQGIARDLKHVVTADAI
jgi:hypothetical protein